MPFSGRKATGRKELGRPSGGPAPASRAAAGQCDGGAEGAYSGVEAVATLRTRFDAAGASGRRSYAAHRNAPGGPGCG